MASVNTHQRFNDYFTALELNLNITGLPSDLTGKFLTLDQQMTANSDFAFKVKSYCQSQIKLLNILETSVKTEEINLKEGIQYFIFMNMISKLGARKTKDSPKIHHWIPLCYAKKFSIKKIQNRNYAIHTVKFSHGETFTNTVADTHFAHGIDSDGNGFYDLNVETFFCNIEAGFIEGIQKIHSRTQQYNGTHYAEFVKLASFFIVQSVRNPKSSENPFAIRTLEGFLTGIISAIDHFDSLFGFFGESQKPMAFTPFVPTRTVVISGVEVLVFASGSFDVFTLSSTPIDQVIFDKAVRIARESLIRDAIKNNSSLYGITAQKI